MQSIKLLIYLAVWKRPEITEICFMGIDRLRKQGKHEVDALAIISEDEMITLCEKYGVRWAMHENLPLGRKKNFGLHEAMKLDFDYLVEIGSDDLLKDEYLDIPFDRDVITLNELAIVNTHTKQCRKLTARDARFGAGRAMSRRAIDAMLKAGLWDDKQNVGLDNRSTFALAKAGFFEKRHSFPEPVVLDLKSDVNIWSFSSLTDRGIEYRYDKALKGLSEQEINAIKCLVQKESEVLIRE
jgi:hypothetical protein